VAYWNYFLYMLPFLLPLALCGTLVGVLLFWWRRR
jgi:hypothetical protein